ncbi:MAG: dephospho-CoA kinase [Trueperaceae bacterium]|nr:dephospho-CoA kinase [Trueperaceae bacterium]
MSSKRIGLTGNIGSGKSTVARLLLEKGASLIDSDQLSRAASQDPNVLETIAKKLGSDLIENGQLRRDKTAALVFNNPEALKTLNGIIHPWVRRETEQQARELEKQAVPPQIILFDIPLLYENGLEGTVDAVIVVNSPLELRIERVKKRSHLSEADIRARDKAQLPLEEKARRADFVICNDKGLDYLQRQVNDVWQKLTAPSA